SCPCRRPRPGPYGSAGGSSRAPGAGGAASLLHLLHLDQVGDLPQLAADLRAVLLDDHVPRALESQAADGGALVLRPPDQRAGLGHLEPNAHAPASLPAPGAAATAAACRWRATVVGDISPSSKPRVLASSS